MTDPAVPVLIAMPGGTELVILLLMVVLLFGATKIPELARSSGQATGEFKRGRQQMEEELAEIRGEDEKTG